MQLKWQIIENQSHTPENVLLGFRRVHLRVTRAARPRAPAPGLSGSHAHGGPGPSAGGHAPLRPSPALPERQRTRNPQGDPTSRERIKTHPPGCGGHSAAFPVLKVHLPVHSVVFPHGKAFFVKKNWTKLKNATKNIVTALQTKHTYHKPNPKFGLYYKMFWTCSLHGRLKSEQLAPETTRKWCAGL